MNKEGITILQMVITVLIMILLATVAVLYGRGIPREANLASTYNEIKEVKSAIKEAYILNQLKTQEDALSIFDEITVPKVTNASYSTVIGEDASGNYYYLDFTTSRKLENVLGAENVKHDYLLNLDDLNMYLIEGIDLAREEGDTLTYNTEEIERYYDNTFKR